MGGEQKLDENKRRKKGNKLLNFVWQVKQKNLIGWILILNISLRFPFFSNKQI